MHDSRSIDQSSFGIRGQATLQVVSDSLSLTVVATADRPRRKSRCDAAALVGTTDRRGAKVAEEMQREISTLI